MAFSRPETHEPVKNILNAMLLLFFEEVKKMSVSQVLTKEKKELIEAMGIRDAIEAIGIENMIEAVDIEKLIGIVGVKKSDRAYRY